MCLKPIRVTLTTTNDSRRGERKDGKGTQLCEMHANGRLESGFVCERLLCASEDANVVVRTIWSKDFVDFRVAL